MKPKSRLNKHDRYVHELYHKIKKDYDQVILDCKISAGKRSLIQVDLLGIKDGDIDIYEVKCSPRYSKASRQLLKARKTMKIPARLFFYCGSDKRIFLVSDLTT